MKDLNRLFVRPAVLLGWVLAAPLAQSEELSVKTSQGVPLVPVPKSRSRMAVWETRVSDWKAFLSATGHAWAFEAPFEQGPDEPVVGVNVADAQAFCDWLTRVERAKRRLTSSQLYRLPTDQEWLAVTTHRPDGGLARFPWGDDWPPAAKSGNFAERSLLDWKDGFVHTAPVGSFPALPSGIFDLCGNVWEWVQSPSGSGASLRGGSWAYLREKGLMTDHVYEVPLELRAPTIGFRIVLGTGAAPAPVVATVPARQAAPSPTTVSPAPVPVDAPETPAPTVAAVEATPAAAASQAMNSGGEDFSSDVDAILRKLAGGVGAMDQSIQENLRPAAAGEPFTNGVGMEFLPLGEDSGVLIGRHEVRARDYDQWLRETSRVWEGKPAFLIGGESAAASVSHENAKQFCGWMTLKDRADGLIPKTAVYRLPTDREWSLAAGLGREVWEQPEQRHLSDEETFPWGKEWPPPAGSVNLDSKKIEGYEDEFPYTAPVKSGTANALGLLNMGGNVSEWCEDRWSARSAEMVIRGGSWLVSDREAALSSHRMRALPKIVRPDVGFRCVLDLKASAGN